MFNKSICLMLNNKDLWCVRYLIRNKISVAPNCPQPFMDFTKVCIPGCKF